MRLVMVEYNQQTMDKIYTENKDMLSDSQIEYIEGIYEICK